jgi:hypothetical protein
MIGIHRRGRVHPEMQARPLLSLLSSWCQSELDWRVALSAQSNFLAPAGSQSESVGAQLPFSQTPKYPHRIPYTASPLSTCYRCRDLYLGSKLFQNIGEERGHLPSLLSATILRKIAVLSGVLPWPTQCPFFQSARTHQSITILLAPQDNNTPRRKGTCGSEVRLFR